MRITNYKSILLILAFLLSFCSSPEKKPVCPEWLLGDWQSLNDENMVESWNQLNDSIYEGSTYLMKDGERKLLETLRLIITGDSLFYHANPTGQNEGKTIVFTAPNNGSDTILFVNYIHDFPQRISYKIIGKDTLHARISGHFNDEWRSADFLFKRK